MVRLTSARRGLTNRCSCRSGPWLRLVRRHPTLEPDMIAGIEVLRDTSLVWVLGRGFENGLLIIDLTPAGTVVRQSAAVRKPTPR